MPLKHTPVPVSVELRDGGKRIVIAWPAGRVTDHRAFDLRAACPCAGCVDEITGVRTLDPGDVDPEVGADAFGRVGRYALQFRWSDGHSSGIYTYEGLREGSGESEERG